MSGWRTDTEWQSRTARSDRPARGRLSAVARLGRVAADRASGVVMTVEVCSAGDTVAAPVGVANPVGADRMTLQPAARNGCPFSVGGSTARARGRGRTRTVDPSVPSPRAFSDWVCCAIHLVSSVLITNIFWQKIVEFCEIMRTMPVCGYRKRAVPSETGLLDI